MAEKRPSLKKRMPELVKDYHAMEKAFLERTEELWSEMLFDFSIKHGLSDDEVDRVEEALK